jgi:putative alpha-1,2-mannosidase
MARPIAFVPVLLAAFLAGGADGEEEAPDAGLVRYVQPLLGSMATERGYGGTMPSVTRPFGMTHWVAATRANGISRLPYWYLDTSIEGFLGTHQPAPWMGDYGYVKLMPGIGEVRPGRSLPFRHETETAEAHRYTVDLDTAAGALRATIAATERCGVLRFDFPSGPGGEAHVVLEAIRSNSFVGGVRIDAEAREISGFNPDRQSAHLGPALPRFRGYFVARFEAPFATWGTWDGGGVHRGEGAQNGTQVGAFVTFGPSVRRVLVKVGTSFLSLDQARRNLEREVPGWDFDAVAEHSRREWEKALGVLRVEGGGKDDLVRFYTALYRTLLVPRLVSEEGRYWSAFDDQPHEGVSYTDFSLWDTFRAEHPLLLLTVPERANDIVRALVQMYDEGGRLPMWPNPAETNIMIGTHADCVIADAWIKGFRGYDVRKAYAAIRKDALEPPFEDAKHRFEDRAVWIGPPAPPGGAGFEAQAGLTFYRSLGYVPYDRTAEAVSRTVEYGIDDFCAAQMARELAPQDLPELMRLSRNYRNLYNPAKANLDPRHSNGKWFDGVYPWDVDAETGHPGFTEGGMFTYLFGAMHDVAGMVEMLGGRERFLARLDENFDGGHHRHDNEPGHHYPYLYDFVGAPAKTQARVRAIMADHYHSGPDGLPGDEDCGQMSAWFVWSALGLYPVAPASGEYALGSPIFPQVTLRLRPPLGNGTLVIRALGASPENVYVQDVERNGTPLTEPFVRHADLVTGETVLTFRMGPKPPTPAGAPSRGRR